jgi:hypothetical protein
MKTSDSIKSIAVALLAAQKSITFAAKYATNPHFKSKYADLPSVIDAVKTPFNEQGIAFLQSCTPSDDGKLHLTTRLLHTSGEWIEDTAVCPLPKQDPQGYGSAITYLRRYSLASLAGLYQADDDGESTRMNANDYIKMVSTSKDLIELKQNFAKAYLETKSDKQLSELVKKTYDDMKALFE